MDWKYDTPPDGDFARYVEQLTARSDSAPPATAREVAAKPPSGPWPGKSAHRQPVQEVPPQVPAGLSLWRMVRWGVMAWVALQIVTVFVPRAGVLTLPLFVALVAWAGYRFKKAVSSAPVLEGLRRMADQAAKEFNQRK